MSNVKVKKLIKSGKQYAFAVYDPWYRTTRYYHTDVLGRGCFEGKGYSRAIVYPEDFRTNGKTTKEVVNLIIKKLGVWQ